MFLWVDGNKLKRVMRDAIVEVEREIANDIAQVGKLKKEITSLQIERDKKLEDFARREREVEHMIGLERKRQEFEIQQAKRETTTALREENLKADKERFEEQMKFHREALQGEMNRLQELVGQLLRRVPSAEILDIREH